MADLPPDDDDQRRASRYQRQTRYIALLALAIAIGHVLYAVIRDHYFDGWIPWWFVGPPPWAR